MIASLRLPHQLRLDIPLRRDAPARFLPWIVASVVYLAAMGGIGLIWLTDALRQWDESLAGALTLQVPANTTQPRTDTVLAALKQTKGVMSARLLGPDETAKLLQPWLGSGVPAGSLPLPRLIDVRVDPYTMIDYKTLHEQLASIVPDARLDDNGSWLGGVRESALRIEGVIIAGVVVATALVMTIVVFTARIGLAIHRSVIELLHLLGAQDAYIAWQFQIHALSLGLRGGLVGAGAAVVTVIVLGPAVRMLQLPVPVAVYGIVDWRMWLLLIATCVIAGGVAMVTARVTVLRQLARMP